MAVVGRPLRQAGETAEWAAGRQPRPFWSRGQGAGGQQEVCVAVNVGALSPEDHRTSSLPPTLL